MIEWLKGLQRGPYRQSTRPRSSCSRDPRSAPVPCTTGSRRPRCAIPEEGLSIRAPMPRAVGAIEPPGPPREWQAPERRGSSERSGRRQWQDLHGERPGPLSASRPPRKQGARALAGGAPKSPSLTRAHAPAASRAGVRNTLAGFTSRWISPAACTSCSPRSTCTAMPSAHCRESRKRSSTSCSVTKPARSRRRARVSSRA